MDTFTTIILLLVVLGAGLMYVEAQHRWKQQLRWYATRTEPFVEFSKHPNDEYVEDRARHHEYMLARSGNVWKVPVIAYPYAKFREGDPRYRSFEDYLSEVDEIRRTARAQFFLRVQQADDAAYKQFILNQKISQQ